jgi:branched-chain amino acid transport system substrate-binding protein
MTSTWNRLLALALCLVLQALQVASAQIRIGQTAGFTGPAAPGVKEISEGAKLWIDAVNARGGVNGQTIELVSLDDKFDPKLAAENAAKLAADKNVVSLFLTRGTPHTQAILPVLAQYKIPLIGPSTGAMLLHDPVHPWLFNVRATYQREAERAVQHLATVGMDRIAVVQVDDTFGADCMAGAERGFRAVDRKPLVHVKYDRSKPDFSAIAPQVAKLEPQAVLVFGTGSTAADAIAAIRKAGSRAQFVTLSNNASSGFVKLLKENARGTVIMQVFPFERSPKTPMVKEAQELAAAAKVPELTPAMLEGYAAAKVLVEGLKRAGANPTRDKLRQALEAMQKVDIGGLELSFGPKDHTGLTFVDLSIIGPEGRFVR